jgi:hypothetical protein
MDIPDAMTLDGPNGPIAFKNKWELHKPLLERLYLDENLKLPKIQEILRSQEDFDAE